MTVYSWGNSAPIEKIEVSDGKAKEAVIVAAESATQSQLAEIPNMLRSQGMTVIPDVDDNGRHVLHVSHITSGEHLAASLEQNGFLPAESRQTQDSPKEPKEKRKPMDIIRQKSLVAGGWGYFLGDAILATAGLMRKDYNEVAQAGAFTVGSLVLMKYGDQKGQKAFDKLYDKMRVEFARDGVEIPDLEHTSVRELTKPGGFVQKIDEFLSKYPTETFTAINAYAGFQGIKAGLTQANPSKVASGSLILVGMAVAALVPEKGKKNAASQTLGEIGEKLGEVPGADKAKAVWQAPAVEEAKGVAGKILKPVSKFTDWVQEKPLRFGGYMAIANNFAATKAALDDRKSNPALNTYLTHKEAGTLDSAEAKQAESVLSHKMAKKSFAELQGLDIADKEDRIKFDAIKERAELASRHGGAWKYNLAAAATYMVSNALLSISSKGEDGGGHGHGGGKNQKDIPGELIAASASILAAQPEGQREELIGKMSFFLSEQRGVPLEPEEIAGKIREKIAQVEDSPWVDRVGGKAAAIPTSKVDAVLQQRSNKQSDYALGA